MNGFIIAGIFLSLAAAVFALTAALVSPASAAGARLQALLGRAAVRERASVKERVEQVLEPLANVVPKSPDDISTTALWLTQAGFREARHATIYFGVRVFIAAVFLVVVIVTGMAMKSAIMLVVAPALGYILPRFLLKRMITARQLSIQLALPDALDLTIVCVEAGLGLDQAVARVASELRVAHPALSEEFGLLNLEVRAGKPRAEALRNLATRTGVEDIKALVAVLIQTERFGTSVANSLRVHADALRTERRQRAEERAAKTTIKMVPVLVFFIFPVMFMVILGPALISVMRNVLPAVNR